MRLGDPAGMGMRGMRRQQGLLRPFDPDGYPCAAGGETHLGDMSRVPKTHPRIAAYGTVDELNAQIGLALSTGAVSDSYADWLRRVQNDLFDVGADISAPEDPDRERLRVVPEQTEWLEQRCDEVNATLKPLRSFVLPGGTPAAAHLHVCRTVCPRGQRVAPPRR